MLMRRGGLTLKEHMIRVMEQSRLMDDQAYRNDLDEKGNIFPSLNPFTAKLGPSSKQQQQQTV